MTVAAPHPAAADPAMPFMAHATDPGYMHPRLQCLLADDGERVELERIRVVRWKHGRRCLVEYQLAAGGGASRRTLIGKVRAKGFDARTCALVTHLAAGPFAPGSSDGVSVPAVRGAIPECHMWLQDKVSGAGGWLAVSGTDGVNVAARIGGALAKLHRVMSPPSRRHAIDDELAHLSAVLRRVQAAHPEWGPRLAAVDRACARLAATARPAVASGVHRDFYHDQVIVDGDRLWLLDLDLAATADPALDAGNFIAHLFEQSLRSFGRPDALGARAAAFIAGFHRAGSDADQQNVEIYTTLSLARHVYLSTTFEDRRPFTHALLTLCEERLQL